MPTWTSQTVVLENGNRVTIRRGENRRGFYKTVTVKRRNGSSESRTVQRGVMGAFLNLGPFDESIPDWAKR